MIENIDYNKVVTVTKDDSGLIEFLLYRLNEIPSWTKKKYALLNIIKQRLSQLNAYTYSGKAKNLSTIGDWTYGSPNHDFLKNTPLEGHEFLQLVIGYSKINTSKRQIALIVLNDKDLSPSTDLLRLFKLVTYDFNAILESKVFDSEVFIKIKRVLEVNGFIELRGEKEVWHGIEVLGENKLHQESCYKTLENNLFDGINVKVSFPDLKMYLLRKDLIAVDIRYE